MKEPVIIGKAKIYHADCMEFMKNIPDNYYELACVDPPYGIKRDKGFGGFGGFGKPIARKKYKGEWDSLRPDINYFNEIQRISKNQIIWGGNFYTDLLPQMNHWIFWDKRQTMPTFGDGELAWTSFDKNSVKRHILEYNGLLGKELDRIHPTQKPIKLYEWLLTNYAKAGDKILDTHGGSFSSAIACNNLGFEMVGCELDFDYFNAAVKRIERAYAQKSLFMVEEPIKEPKQVGLYE